MNEVTNIDEIESSAKIKNRKKEQITAAVFLSGVGGLSLLAGFGSSLATIRKKNPQIFHTKVINQEANYETAVRLALRALGLGSIYSITACSVIFYGIWKLSGASNFLEFRFKMGSILPKLTQSEMSDSE